MTAYKLKNLETDESRKEAFGSVQKDLEMVNLQRRYLAAVFTHISREILQKAIQNDAGDALDDLPKGRDALLRAIMNIDFQIANLDTLYLSKQVTDLIGQYEIVFKAFKLDLKLIDALKQLYFSQKNKVYYLKQKLEAAWCVGQANIFEELQAGFTPVEAKLHELSEKKNKIRDKWMVKQIHPLLQQSSLEKRYFFCCGLLSSPRRL